MCWLFAIRMNIESFPKIVFCNFSSVPYLLNMAIIFTAAGYQYCERCITKTVMLNLHNTKDRIFQSDRMYATLPLRHGRVHVDSAGLRPEPHRRQHRTHLLDLRKRDLILTRDLGNAVDNLG